MTNCRPDGIESPLLKARVHLKENERVSEISRGREEDKVSTKIMKEMIESDTNEEEDHKRSRENRTCRKRDEDDVIREANERKES